MKLEIHSFDELKVVEGQRPRSPKRIIVSSDLTVDTRSGNLEIRCEQNDSATPIVFNDLAETPTTKIRRLGEVILTPQELRAIFEYAVSEKLVALDTSICIPSAQ